MAPAAQVAVAVTGEGLERSQHASDEPGSHDDRGEGGRVGQEVEAPPRRPHVARKAVRQEPFLNEVDELIDQADAPNGGETIRAVRSEPVSRAPPERGS